MTHDFKPLETDRLVMRMFDERDLNERYVSWLNDPETVQYSEQRHRQHTLESCASYLSAMCEKQDWFLAVLRKKDAPTHIGNLSVVFDRHNLTASISIMIGDPGARGLGFGVEAWSAVTTHLLDAGGMRKVTAGTMSVNKAMLAVARKSGMVEEGRQKRHFIYKGTEVDCVQFARFAFSPGNGKG